MKRLSLMMLGLVAGIACMKAQIGYQVSLLNTATGEARANETVKVTVSLSNSEGEVFYSETKSATTNDFGVLSLTVGNADTFKDVDLTKMPFFIEASANGVMIGKSQILSVPVAEVAKQVAPLDKSLLVGTWQAIERYEDFRFFEDGTAQIINSKINTISETGTYTIYGNFVVLRYKDRYDGDEQHYGFSYHNGLLWWNVYGSLNISERILFKQ